MILRRLKTLSLIFSGLWLSGCAVQTGDDKAAIAEQLQNMSLPTIMLPMHKSEKDAAAARVSELLQQPLTLEHAIEVAVLNNPSIQAELWSLGIAQADLRQLSTLPNPGVKFSRGLGKESHTELEFGLNLLALITLPQVRELALQDYQMARIAIAQRISLLIHETKLAYWHAIAAQEVLFHVEKGYQATQATAELARRMAATGNFNKLKFLREQRYFSDSTLNLIMARQSQANHLAKLERQLGLWQHTSQLKLPARLPDLPLNETSGSQVEAKEMPQQSLQQRLDVQLVRLQLTQLAQALDLTRNTRLVNVFTGEVHGEVGNSDEHSYSLIFELPVFDSGQHRVNRQQAQYQQAFAQATAVGIRARSELQQSYEYYQTQRAIALHYQQTVEPLAQQIAEENQLLYNGMFISVFELLADARDQITAMTDAIHANRDYWIAKAQLELARTGTPDGNFPSALFKQAAVQVNDKKDH
jgi:outer membrane protein TolC